MSEAPEEASWIRTETSSGKHKTSSFLQLQHRDDHHLDDGESSQSLFQSEPLEWDDVLWIVRLKGSIKLIDRTQVKVSEGQ